MLNDLIQVFASGKSRDRDEPDDQPGWAYVLDQRWNKMSPKPPLPSIQTTALGYSVSPDPNDPDRSVITSDDSLTSKSVRNENLYNEEEIGSERVEIISDDGLSTANVSRRNADDYIQEHGGKIISSSVTPEDYPGSDKGFYSITGSIVNSPETGTIAEGALTDRLFDILADGSHAWNEALMLIESYHSMANGVETGQIRLSQASQILNEVEGFILASRPQREPELRNTEDASPMNDQMFSPIEANRPRITPPKVGEAGLLPPSIDPVGPNGRSWLEIQKVGTYLSVAEREWFLNQIGKTISPNGEAVPIPVQRIQAAQAANPSNFPTISAQGMRVPKITTGEWVTLPADLVSLIQNIFPQNQWEEAYLIVAAETGGKNIPGMSASVHGYFQIHEVNFSSLTQALGIPVNRETIYNPEVNVLAAREINMRSGGWAATSSTLRDYTIYIPQEDGSFRARTITSNRTQNPWHPGPEVVEYVWAKNNAPASIGLQPVTR